MHTNSPKSKHSEKNKAKELLYSWGNADLSLIKKVIAESKKPNQYTGVVLEDLINCFHRACGKFIKETGRDERLSFTCSKRVKEFYSHVKIQS